jgi:hypothetical protein
MHHDLAISRVENDISSSRDNKDPKPKYHSPQPYKYNELKTHRSLYEKTAGKLLTTGRRYITGTSTVMMIVQPSHGSVTSNRTSFAKGYEGILGGAS